MNHSRKPVVGLTGGIGSGKTAVSNRMAELGAHVIDTDLIAHQLTAPGGLAIPALIATFGAQCIQQDGAMNRAYMRQRVFDNPDERKQLEGILHPLIRDEVGARLQKDTGLYSVLVIPLLIEKGGWMHLLDHIVVVDCDTETQIKRVMDRNGFTREQVIAILKTQADRQARLSRADLVIKNNSSLSELIEKTDWAHGEILKLRLN
ncbi:dephospho-CoA kinase [Limnobacter sp.]|uniref:dephospho-CoA kinase n=1 Tax=Limnobacter sp. TaxID=2003368 RepID=UPI002590627A|nr:dephospho-CoA kinase [Limnobacter sp.]